MSASYTVDLGNTAQMSQSLNSLGAGSGLTYATSGARIGVPIDLRNANAFCNTWLAGQPAFNSGQLRVAVQTSPDTTSGNFTDPTSGLAQIPPPYQSGGILWLNSGGIGGGFFGANVSGQNIYSGFMVGAGFQRPQNGYFGRLVVLSGDFYAGELQGGFISQLRTTGSGGGTSQSPQSGTPSV